MVAGEQRRHQAIQLSLQLVDLVSQGHHRIAIGSIHMKRFGECLSCLHQLVAYR